MATEAGEEKKKTGGLKTYLDNTFTDSGLRTDVRITLTNETAAKIVAVAVCATAISTVTFFLIKGMFTNK